MTAVGVDHLAAVAKTARAVGRAREVLGARLSERDAAIVAAKDAGASYGQIAEAAQMRRSAVQAVVERASGRRTR